MNKEWIRNSEINFSFMCWPYCPNYLLAAACRVFFSSSLYSRRCHFQHYILVFLSLLECPLVSQLLMCPFLWQLLCASPGEALCIHHGGAIHATLCPCVPAALCQLQPRHPFFMPWRGAYAGGPWWGNGHRSDWWVGRGQSSTPLRSPSWAAFIRLCCPSALLEFSLMSTQNPHKNSPPE